MTDNAFRRLTVAIGGNIDQLKRTLADMERRIDAAATKGERSLGGLDSAFGAIGKAGGALLPVLGALGIATSVGGLASMARQALDAAGGLGELADQAGVTTDFLQELQFAGTQAGASAQDIQAALARLTKTLGLAAAGNTEAVEKFRAVGIAVRDAGGSVRTTEAVLRDLADAVARAPSGAEKAAIVFRLLEDAGQRLIPILQGGSQGLKDFAADARAANVVLNKDQIAAANKAAAAIAAYEKSWARLQQRLAIGVLPALKLVIDSMAPPQTDIDYIDEAALELEAADLTQRIAKVRRRLADALALPDVRGQRGNRQNAIAQEQAALFALLRRQTEVERLLAARKPSTTPAAPAPAPAATPPAIPKAANDVLTGLRDELAALDLTARQRAIDTALRRANTTAATAEGQQIAALAGRLYDEGRARQIQADSLTRAAEAAKSYADEGARRAPGLSQVVKDREKLVAGLLAEADGAQRLLALGQLSLRDRQVEIKLLQIRNQFRAAGIPLLDAELERYRQLAGQIVDAGIQTENQKAAQQQLNDILVQGFGSVGNSLSSSLLKGESALKSLGSVGLQVVDALVSAFIRLAAINPLLNAVGLSGGTPLPTLSSSGLFGGGRAAGGPVSGRKVYRVGEHGPELFMPPGSGRIVPAHEIRPPGYRLGPMGGGGDVQVTVIDQRGQGAPVETRQTTGPGGRRQIQILVRDAVRAEVGQGGLDRAMGERFGATPTPVRR